MQWKALYKLIVSTRSVIAHILKSNSGLLTKQTQRDPYASSWLLFMENFHVIIYKKILNNKDPWWSIRHFLC